MKTTAAKTWFRGLASLLLLFGYFLNVVSFESFHQAVHQHDHSEFHSDTAEADPCHRAIYHGDIAADCHHSEHITKAETECNLCDVVNTRDHHTGSESIAPLSFSSTVLLSDVEQNGSLQWPFKDFDVRGPPLV